MADSWADRAAQYVGSAFFLFGTNELNVGFPSRQTISRRYFERIVPSYDV